MFTKYLGKKRTINDFSSNSCSVKVLLYLTVKPWKKHRLNLFLNDIVEEAIRGELVKDRWHQGREITLSKGTSSNLFRSFLLFFENSELLCKTSFFFFRSATLGIFQALDLDKFGVAFVLELSL